jgi:hypothetical protein
MRQVLSARAWRPLHGQDVPVESGQGLGHRGHRRRELPYGGAGRAASWPGNLRGRSRRRRRRATARSVTRRRLAQTRTEVTEQNFDHKFFFLDKKIPARYL